MKIDLKMLAGKALAIAAPIAIAAIVSGRFDLKTALREAAVKALTAREG